MAVRARAFGMPVVVWSRRFGTDHDKASPDGIEIMKSPQEVAAVRAAVGQDITLITPGVRLAGEASHDQARVATPQEALREGADLLVIGRPITGASDPGAAAAALATALRRREPAAGR